MLWGGRAQGPKEIGDIDTDDEKDEEAEYEQWKSRELRRIRRARWLHRSVPLPCRTKRGWPSDPCERARGSDLDSARAAQHQAHQLAAEHSVSWTQRAPARSILQDNHTWSASCVPASFLDMRGHVAEGSAACRRESEERISGQPYPELSVVDSGMLLSRPILDMRGHVAEGSALRRRDREEREREVAEAEQREALKNMTEAERRAWEAAHPKELAEAPKKKWRFLQKYWHKGAFFQARPATRPRCYIIVLGKQFAPPHLNAFCLGPYRQAQKLCALRMLEKDFFGTI